MGKGQVLSFGSHHSGVCIFLFHMYMSQDQIFMYIHSICSLKCTLSLKEPTNIKLVIWFQSNQFLDRHCMLQCPLLHTWYVRIDARWEKLMMCIVMQNSFLQCICTQTDLAISTLDSCKDYLGFTLTFFSGWKTLLTPRSTYLYKCKCLLLVKMCFSI